MYISNYLCYIQILFSLIRSSFMNQVDPGIMASIQFTQTMVKENGLSKKQCANACVSETRFNCKYFRYISGVGTCYLAIEEHLKMDDKPPKYDQDLSQIDLFQERLSAMELLVKFLSKKINKLEEMQEKLAHLKIEVMKEAKKKYSLMNEVRKSAMNQEEAMEILTDKLKHLESKDSSNLAVVETFKEMVSDIEKQNTQIKNSLRGLSLKIQDLMSAWTMISSELKSINVDIVGMGRKILDGSYKNKELDNKIENVKTEGIKRARMLARKISEVEKMEKELFNSDSLEGRLKHIESQIETLSSNTAINTASLEEIESLKSFYKNKAKSPDIQKEMAEIQDSVLDLQTKQQNLEDMLLMGQLFKNIHSDKKISPILSANYNLISPKTQFSKLQDEESFDKHENMDENQNHFVMASHTGVHHLDEDDHLSHVESKINVVHIPPQNNEFSEEESLSLNKGTSPCPSGWSKSTSHCFIFLPNLMNWNEAKSSCAHKGGHVALAADLDEWKSVRIFLAIHSNLSSSVWLSHVNKHPESEDGDDGHVHKSLISFHPRRVSGKVHSHVAREEDCLIMEPINQFTLSKVFCDSTRKHATICERQLSKGDDAYESILSRIKHASNDENSGLPRTNLLASASPSILSSDNSNLKVVRNIEQPMKGRHQKRRDKTCPSFGQQISGLCFKYISSEQTVTKAMNTCKGMGGNLVTVENVQSQIALEKFLMNLGIFHTIWLSPSISIDGTHWTWESNHKSVTFTNYLDGRPDTENHHRCNQMRKEWAFKWLDKYCSDSTNNQVRHPFVCQF